MSSYTNTALSYIRALQTGRNLTAEVIGDDALCEHKKSHCTHARSIAGRLISNVKLPVAGQKVNFFIKDFSNFKYFIGSAKSNADGAFKLNYTWNPGIFSRSQRVVMEVVDEHLPFTEKGLLCVKKDVLLQRIEHKLPLNVNHNDIGNVALTYIKTSNDLTAIPPPLPNHTQSPHYFIKFFKAALPEAVKRVFVTAASRFLSTSAVQRIYDSFGPSYPKRALTAENLIEELLNHVCAVGAPAADPVVWEAKWDGLDLEKTDTLPNVSVTASKDDHGNLKLSSIAIRFRDDLEDTIVTPLDANLPWALFVARSVFALKGEAEFHLAEGHILPGVCAQEFFTYIKPEHPLFSVLQPHLSQLDFINWLGSKGIIFGSGSVLDISALTPDSVAKVIIDHVKAKADWVNYKPQEPLATNHYLAKAEAFHFNLLYDFFKEYINSNRQAIADNWEAIQSWSKAMHEHLNELPLLADTDSLVKFCAWLVSKTTFLHWAAHSRQQLLADVGQASLAMEQKGHDAQNGLAPFGNMLVNNANQQLFVARALLNFDGDSIFKNPYGDVNKRLLEILEQHKAKYEGYADIEKMFITTQI